MSAIPPVCRICSKSFKSMTTYYVHKRENHTYVNTEIINCTCCLNPFHSVMFNEKKNKRYIKCDECRDLLAKLETNDLINNSLSI